MLTFLEMKARLKLKISEELQHGSDPAAQTASNIAVYLFPELLPDQDLEKTVALETWLPLERTIEGAPHTRRSHDSFLQLQSDIWNYENADRGEPALTPIAAHVLRIYEVLSSP